jgi:iron complex outermembrane recepter protein
MRSQQVWLGTLLLLLSVSAATAQQSEPQRDPTQKVALNIAELPIGDALREFGHQTGLHVVLYSDLAKGLRSTRLSGLYTATSALNQLLANTGLRYEYIDTQTVAVLPIQAETKSLIKSDHGIDRSEGIRLANAQSDTTPSSDIPSLTKGQDRNEDEESGENARSKDWKLEEVIVTGTYIRGNVPAGSPVKIYTREDIDQSGVATIEQFSQKMTENFAATAPGTNILSNGNTIGAGSNSSNGAAFNLHGLGVGATLTLVDGHRIAAGGDNGDFVDISLIPLSAIERIEVLADGASALYGADAVAGVVNIILRKDFEGAESSVRYAAPTQGGGDETTASQVLGHSWTGGNAMLVYQFDKQNILDASGRDFVPIQSGPFTLLPEKKRNSAILTGNQAFGDGTNLSWEGIYSDSKYTQDQSNFGLTSLSGGGAKLYGATLGLEQRLGNDWRADATATYSKVAQPGTTDLTAFPLDIATEYGTSLADLRILADGTVLALPGGTSKAAFGAEFSSERFGSDESETYFGAPLSSESQRVQRRAASAFGELLIPLVGVDNSVRGVRQLEISLAARYDHYSDTGQSTNPKIGLKWTPLKGLSFRGSYSTSFHAPPLPDLAAVPSYSEVSVPNSNSPSGFTTTLINNSGNPQLRPETSNSYTGGFDFKPQLLPNLSLSATYFDITFKNRFATPPVIGTLNLGQTQLAPFIQSPPNPAALAAAFATGAVSSTPGLSEADVQAVFDDRTQNIALSREAGIDFTTRYEQVFSIGSGSVFANASYLLRNDYTSVVGVPSVALLNVLNEPVRLRLHIGASWTAGGLGASIIVNHTGDYENPTVVPNQDIASWTTADMQLSYKISGMPWRFAPNNVVISLSALNIANAQPPHVNYPTGSQVNIGYDALNSTPVGRVVALQMNVLMQ